SYTALSAISVLSLHDALPIYGDFGGGDFQTHEAVIVVEKEKNFEVGRGDLETFIGFAIGRGGAGGFDGDGAGSELLRDEDGESLDRKSTRLNSSHVSISYAVF